MALAQLGTQLGMVILGLLLFLVAPKIVGYLMRVLGIALILVGVLLYRFPELITAVPPESTWATMIAVLPALAGVFLVVVGEGMAKLAVRIAGILLIISALTSMGIVKL